MNRGNMRSITRGSGGDRLARSQEIKDPSFWIRLLNETKLFGFCIFNGNHFLGVATDSLPLIDFGARKMYFIESLNWKCPFDP